MQRSFAAQRTLAQDDKSYCFFRSLTPKAQSPSAKLEARSFWHRLTDLDLKDRNIPSKRLCFEIVKFGILFQLLSHINIPSRLHDPNWLAGFQAVLGDHLIKSPNKTFGGEAEIFATGGNHTITAA